MTIVRMMAQRFIETAREVAKPLMKGRCKGP